MKYYSKLCITLVLTLLSPAVFAHDNNLTHSLFSGMLHPLLGLDHLFALILAGVLIARLKSAQCKTTGAVTLALIVGAIGAVFIGSQTGLQAAWVEAAILFSIPLYIALLWLQKTAQTLSISIMSVFMIAHGWAHGLEISAASHDMNHLMDNTGFMVGFVLTCITIISVINVFITSYIITHQHQDHARP